MFADAVVYILGNTTFSSKALFHSVPSLKRSLVLQPGTQPAGSVSHTVDLLGQVRNQTITNLLYNLIVGASPNLSFYSEGLWQ